MTYDKVVYCFAFIMRFMRKFFQFLSDFVIYGSQGDGVSYLRLVVVFAIIPVLVKIFIPSGKVSSGSYGGKVKATSHSSKKKG